MVKVIVRAKSTHFSSGSWVESKDFPRVAVSSMTQVGVSPHVVLLQGKSVQGAHGRQELSVSVDPVALERKLAIREMRANLEGGATTMDTTSSGTTSRR